MALVPSARPDIPLRIAKAFLEESGIEFEVGPGGDWHMTKGDLYMPFVPSNSTALASMSFEGICAKFQIDCDNAIIAVHAMMKSAASGG